MSLDKKNTIGDFYSNFGRQDWKINSIIARYRLEKNSREKMGRRVRNILSKSFGIIRHHSASFGHLFAFCLLVLVLLERELIWFCLRFVIKDIGVFFQSFAIIRLFYIRNLSICSQFCGHCRVSSSNFKTQQIYLYLEMRPQFFPHFIFTSRCVRVQIILDAN